MPPSKYVPTGRPPGRPPKAQPEAPVAKDVRAVLANTTADRASLPLVAICPDCFPNGWDKPGLTAVQCEHGIWVKRGV